MKLIKKDISRLQITCISKAVEIEDSLSLDKIRKPTFTIENHQGISANKYSFLENPHFPIRFYIFEE